MRLLLGLTVLVMVAAGCIRGEDTTLFRAHGSGPVAFVGYDYAGLTAQAGAGEANITVDAAKDTGTATFTFALMNKTFAVSFTKFAQTKPFQEGGIRNGFQEHGSTGNGDAMLPAIHALSAGWGTGTVTVDGALFTDPAGGGQDFALHYMVTDNGVRDASSHKVMNAAGSGPYDPAKPEDARVLQGQKQIYLNVQSKTATASSSAAINVQGTVPTAGTDETKDVATVNGSAPAHINITYTMQNAAGGLVPIPAAGQVTFSLLADGKAVDSCDVSFPPDPTQSTAGCTHDLPSAAPGVYTLHVASTLATGNPYSVTGTIQQAAQTVFFHVVYGDVTLG